VVAAKILGFLVGAGVLALAGCGGGDENGVAGPSVGGSASGGASAAGGTGGSSASGGTGGSSAAGGTGGISVPDAGPTDQDTDGDGMLDSEEGTDDDDGDGIPNYLDPINDGAPDPITLTAISTTFNSPIGIDWHEPSNTVIVSVNYPTGTPTGFETIKFDGSHQQFSNLTGLTDEVKIATVKSGNPQGFKVGDLFVGNGVDGQIVRITDDGQTVINPWVDLPGDNNGLMRGSLYVDQVGTFAGDLIAVTTSGEVWRITKDAVPSKIASLGVHLEGLLVVPNKPARFGPIAGQLIIGAEEQGVMHAIAPDGTHTEYTLGVNIEDIDYIAPKQNFFGVNFGTSNLLGSPYTEWKKMMGDVLLTQEDAGAVGHLFRLKWDGSTLVAQPIDWTPQSATVGQWEHVTFAGAGIVEIPPVPK
jgi:hypothetical protein